MYCLEKTNKGAPARAGNQHAQIYRAIDATSPLVRIRIPLGETAGE